MRWPSRLSFTHLINPRTWVNATLLRYILQVSHMSEWDALGCRAYLSNTTRYMRAKIRLDLLLRVWDSEMTSAASSGGTLCNAEAPRCEFSQIDPFLRFVSSLYWTDLIVQRGHGGWSRWTAPYLHLQLATRNLLTTLDLLHLWPPTSMRSACGWGFAEAAAVVTSSTHTGGYQGIWSTPTVLAAIRCTTQTYSFCALVLPFFCSYSVFYLFFSFPFSFDPSILTFLSVISYRRLCVLA